MAKDTEKENKNDDEHNGRVRVFIRLKPCHDQEQATYNVTPNGNQLHVPDAQGRIELDKWYKFDRVYSSSSSNREVYKRVGSQLVESALTGINGALFAYGQTGSGKTHTLMSKDGMAAHVVSHLFNKVWNDTSNDYKITCSYLQIYQEKIYDLLNSNPKLDFNIREDPQNGTFVENVTSFICHSPADVYALLNIGRKRLVFGETKMNRASSRSHAVCQIIIERKTKDDEEKFPIEVSSPKLQKPSIEIPDLEFETIPYRQSSLRKRHSIAVSTPTFGRGNLLKKRPTTPGRSTLMRPESSRNIKKRYSANFDRAYSPDLLSPRSNTPEPRSLRRSVTTGGSFRSLKRISVNLEEGASRLTIRRSSRPETPDLSRLESFMLSQDNLSNELSMSTDSVIDDMQWQMDHSTADISKMFDPELKTSSEEEVRLCNKCSEYAPPDRRYLKTLMSKFVQAFDTNASSETNLLDQTYDEEDQQSITDETQDSLIKEDSSENGSHGNVMLRSKLSIVDLAGSERVKKSHATGERLHEAQHINLSLLELGNVISALADGNRTHVPYRNSVLTRLLQDSLGGNCKTSFILCTSSAMDDLHETKCTLEFGQRLQKVVTQPKVNVEVDFKGLCEELQSKLKEKDAIHSKATEELKNQLSTVEQEKNILENDHTATSEELSEYKKQLDEEQKKNAELQDEISLFRQKQCQGEELLREQEQQLAEIKTQLEQLTNETLLAMDKEVYDVAVNTDVIQTQSVSTSPIDFPNNMVNSETNTSPMNTLRKSLNKQVSVSTSPIHELRKTFITQATSPLHQKYSNINSENVSKPMEMERMRNVLLAELMSLQLLYSMFDLRVTSSNDVDHPLTHHDHIRRSDQKDDQSSKSTTPSGYETGSHSDIQEKPEDNNLPPSRNVTPEFFRLPHNEPIIHDETDPPLEKMDDSYLPKTSGLLEEIIEAQMSGCFSSPCSVSILSVDDRVQFLRKEIGNHKQKIDEELFKISTDVLNGENTKEGGRVEKRSVYTKLVQTLSDPDYSLDNNTIEDFEQLLNLVLVDHSLTGCLLALSHNKNNLKTTNEKMMRRLSSFKSTNQKSLLDYIEIDQELYGYENEAVVFNDDDDENMDDVDSVDNIMDYDAPDMQNIDYGAPNTQHIDYGVPDTPDLTKKTSDVNLDSEGSEINSDSECESPTLPKKGLKRFFCMPMKSVKASSLRKSFRRKKTPKQQSLLDE